MIDTDPKEWGVRLSDRLRKAVGSEDYATARTLCLQGDGEARNLAKEFSLMFKGLAAAVLVLLDGIVATLERDSPRPAGDAGPAAVLLLGNFRKELVRLLADLGSTTAAPPALSGELRTESAAVATLLDEALRIFHRAQDETARAIAAAIDDRDRAQTLMLLDRKEKQEYLPLHDCFVRFMADAFAWTLQHFGNDGLLRFHLATAEALRGGFEAWEHMPARDFARATAFLLKQHMGKLLVTETAERFTFEQELCGSGGRLRTTGAYDGANALPFVEDCAALTFGKPRLPVYCSHCPVWNGVAPINWFGHPHWVFTDPSRADGGCTFHIYKRPDDAPAHYAQQLGQRAPARR